MATTNDVSFSINFYDEDGDIYDENICIHIGLHQIIRFNNMQELEDFSQEVWQIIKELKEHHVGQYR